MLHHFAIWHQVELLKVL